MAGEATGFLAGLKKESSDIIMIVAFIGILMAMILPLHPIVLDFFLALNISRLARYAYRPFHNVVIGLQLFRGSGQVLRRKEPARDGGNLEFVGPADRRRERHGDFGRGRPRI